MEGVERVFMVRRGRLAVVIRIWTAHGVGGGGAGHVGVVGGGGGPQVAGGRFHLGRELRLDEIVFINIWLELGQSIKHRGERLDHVVMIIIMRIVLLVVTR